MPATGLGKSSKDLRHGVGRSHIALAGVYEISKLLATPARIEASLAGVMHLLANFLDMRHGLIALFDETGAPEMVVGSGWSEATAKRYFERLPERAIGRIVVTKMPLVIEHMKKDALFASWDFTEWGEAEGEFSFIGVPIKDRGKVIGTLTIDREHGDMPYISYDEDIRFLTMVANLLGQTVRLQRLIARDREWLMHEHRRLEKAIAHNTNSSESGSAQADGIIGKTPVIHAVMDRVRRVARSHSPVLLRGESGTGKELFAKALHDLSPRHKGPFVAVNCAALAESVLESELFGHEKGAFTGAIAQRKGRFELADHGTLFLDEIGEISPAFQAKLLRVLQLGEFERVGGSSTVKVDVRLVAATNRNLEESVAKGDFRSDLYYRVSVVPIFLPPLRDRKEDIPLLAREFLNRFNTEHQANLALTESAMGVLSACYFPGNVRELENCVRRTATLAHGTHIVAQDFACRHDECMSSLLWKNRADLPESFGAPPRSRVRDVSDPVVMPAAPTAPTGCGACPTHAATPGEGRAEPLDQDPETEGTRLIEAMERVGWVQAKAARLLGLSPRQIGYALRKHGITVKKF